jgi:molecular chaperone DnaK
MNKIVGIDLGTTFSSWHISRTESRGSSRSRTAKKTLPSVVSFDGDEIIVGENAQKQEYADKCVNASAQNGTDFKVKLTAGSSRRRNILLHPQELKEQAEEYLGEELKTAIITVPAYFNDNQRQATKNAGKLAGLEVLRIVNEPTAASLSYGVKPEDDLNIVVYDLGGGTFDVSVLNVGEGIFEVVSTAGDNNLGGEDFNARIEELVVGKFREETGIDLSSDPLAMSKIYEAVESAKRELSEKDATRISIPFVTADESGAKNSDFELTRAEFEKLIADYIGRTIELTKQAVVDGGLALKEIDRVIMVGGSSRIPLARAMVEELFGKAPDCGIDPEEVVARGAAIQGGIVQGDISGNRSRKTSTPFPSASKSEQGYFVPIHRGVIRPIPIVAKARFSRPSHNNQKSVASTSSSRARACTPGTTCRSASSASKASVPLSRANPASRSASSWTSTAS